jgi:hypothetical protein
MMRGTKLVFLVGMQDWAELDRPYWVARLQTVDDSEQGELGWH